MAQYSPIKLAKHETAHRSVAVQQHMHQSCIPCQKQHVLSLVQPDAMCGMHWMHIAPGLPVVLELQGRLWLQPLLRQARVRSHAASGECLSLQDIADSAQRAVCHSFHSLQLKGQATVSCVDIVWKMLPFNSIRQICNTLMSHMSLHHELCRQRWSGQKQNLHLQLILR